MSVEFQGREYHKWGRWTFSSDLDEFEHAFVIRRVKDDPDNLVEIVVAFAEEWSPRYDLCGLVLGMSSADLDRSVLERVQVEAGMPDCISDEYTSDEDVDNQQVSGAEVVPHVSGTVNEALHEVRERLLTLERSIRIGALEGPGRISPPGWPHLSVPVQQHGPQ